MKIYSLNVNGLRSGINKGLENFIASEKPDILCLQEIKCNSPLLELKDYFTYYNYCNKKGYSGTAIFSKYKPEKIIIGLNDDEFDCEGRIMTLEYSTFYLVNVYVPNSQSALSRVDYRMQWDELFYEYISNLEKRKPVIMCGDFNICDKELVESDDIEFINNEQAEFENLLDIGFVDAFKYLYPNNHDGFTWWNVGNDLKENKDGYRLDYFLVSKYLINNIIDIKLFQNVDCSDHCPISLIINLEV